MGRMMPRLATAVLLATALTTLAGSPAQASSIQSYLYNTTGDIAGVTGSGLGYPISITPVTSNEMLTTPGTFVLGTITTNPLPTGATLSYDNTPFSISLNVGQVPSNGNNYGYYNSPYYNGFAPAYTYKISGVLNGNLMGNGTSTLFPTITSITGSGSAATPPFPVDALKFNLQGIAAPNGTTYGTTTLTAHVDVTGTPLPAPAPEPTSVAVFAAALAGWTWARRRTTSRKTSV